jgi:hypothetical protein
MKLKLHFLHVSELDLVGKTVTIISDQNLAWSPTSGRVRMRKKLKNDAFLKESWLQFSHNTFYAVVSEIKLVENKFEHHFWLKPGLKSRIWLWSNRNTLQILQFWRILCSNFPATNLLSRFWSQTSRKQVRQSFKIKTWPEVPHLAMAWNKNELNFF